jgi:hypothetical protein
MYSRRGYCRYFYPLSKARERGRGGAERRLRTEFGVEGVSDLG